LTILYSGHVLLRCGKISVFRRTMLTPPSECSSETLVFYHITTRRYNPGVQQLKLLLLLLLQKGLLIKFSSEATEIVPSIFSMDESFHVFPLHHKCMPSTVNVREHSFNTFHTFSLISYCLIPYTI